MTANQSTVKSDMATVDYGSFQPTKPHCVLSNCLSYPKKRNTSEVEFFFACANKLSAVIKCAQSPYALMARLGHSLRKRRLFPEVYITSRCGKLSWIQVWKNRKRKFTAADSSDRGTPATLSESENAECCI